MLISFSHILVNSICDSFSLVLVNKNSEKSVLVIHFLYPLNPSVGYYPMTAYPSGHQARGGVHPGQVASPSQGHTETNETNNHTHTDNFRVTN